MRSAKMRNGRAVLYSSATTATVNASSGVIWQTLTTWLGVSWVQWYHETPHRQLRSHRLTAFMDLQPVL